MNMKLFIIPFITLLTFVGVNFASPPAYAENPLTDACAKLSPADRATAEACQASPSTNPISGPDGILLKVTNIVALIAGTAAVIIIIIAGLQFVFSNGDSQKAASARSAIIYAIVGLLVILAARGIIAFVITEL